MSRKFEGLKCENTDFENAIIHQSLAYYLERNGAVRVPFPVKNKKELKRLLE